MRKRPDVIRPRGWFVLPGAIFVALLAPVAAFGGDADTANLELLASQVTSDAESLGALGTYWDTKAGELAVVFTGRPSSEVVAAIGRFGIGVRVESVQLSADEIEAAKTEVLELVKLGRLKGASTEVAANLKTGVLEITSTADASVFGEILDSLHGRGSYTQTSGAFVRLFNRFDDSPPYYGGGEVNNNAFECSSGFAVRKGGVGYMATAGHCFENINEAIFDGAGDDFGSLKFRAGFPARDTELIGGKTYSGTIFIGPQGQTLTRPVTGATDPGVGFTYCSSGIKTFEICNLNTTGNHIFACDPDGFCTDKMVRFSNDDPWLEGDSGGPIFLKFNNPPSVGARGTIIGSWLGNSYGQEWSAIANAFNATICTTHPC